MLKEYCFSDPKELGSYHNLVVLLSSLVQNEDNYGPVKL